MWQWTASSRNARYSSLEVRGKSRMGHQYWQYAQQSGSVWWGKVCLWSLGGCAFLKGACFPSLLPFCIRFPDFAYGFSYGTAPPFDKGDRAGGTEVPTSFYLSLFPSLISIHDHPQHPLCTHDLLLSSLPGGAWAECTRHQGRYQDYLCSCRCTRQRGQVVQADCYTLEQSCIFGILNTLKVYKPTLQVKCLLSIINPQGLYSVTCSLVRSCSASSFWKKWCGGNAIGFICRDFLSCWLVFQNQLCPEVQEWYVLQPTLYLGLCPGISVPLLSVPSEVPVCTTHRDRWPP